MSRTEEYIASLCSRTYNGTANRYPNSSGTEEPAATHGAYGSNGNWIGMVLLPDDLTGENIQSITYTMTANSAGNGSYKTVYVYSSHYQSTHSEGYGSMFPNEQLGRIEGIFRNRTTVVELTGTFFSRVKNYYESGKRMLILYDPDGLESNYCRFTEILITIVLGDGESTSKDNNTISYCYQGRMVPCKVYYQYNGRFVQVKPYYRHRGSFVECSTD